MVNKAIVYRRRVRPKESAVIFVMALLLAARGPADDAGFSGARGGPSAGRGRATPAVSRTAADSGARARAQATTPAATKNHPTTLEEITIQGEIDVPQVLFITGRPRPLYDDGSYRLFRPTPQRLLEEVTLPSEIFLQHPNTPRAGGKEVVR
jgi:hypothetical protein